MKDRLPHRWIVFLAWAMGMMLIVSSLLFPSRPIFAASNLLVNPGFETGTTSWSESQKSSFTFAITTTVVHSGTYAAALTSNGSTSSKFISQTITGIAPGSNYSAAGYGYIADANSSKIYLRIAWYSTADCSGSQLSTVDSNAIITLGAYQPMTITSKTAPANAQCARLRAELYPISSASTTAYFDDVSFSKDDPPTSTFTPTNTPTFTSTSTPTKTPTSTPTNSPTFTPTSTPTKTPTSTPTQTPTPTATRVAEKLVITEVLYDGTQVDDGDEFVEVANLLTKAVDIGGYKLGDEETQGGGESMYVFPSGTMLVSNATLIIARNAAQFHNRFGFDPNFELVTTGVFTDTLSVPNLDKYTAWATGSFSLANDGDEVLLLGPNNELVDSVAWSNGNFAVTNLRGHASAPQPQSLQRYGSYDTNSMTYDFLKDAPSPGKLIPALLSVPSSPQPGATMPNGMFAYWGDLHSHSTASDGSGPPRLAFATARMNGLHFFALTDHDTTMTQDDWDEIGNAALAATGDGAFIGLRGFEYTNSQGHLSVFGTNTWVSHNDPNFDTLSKMYAWLAAQSNAIAQFNHPDWKYGGDFDNFAFNAAAIDRIVLQEVGNNGAGYTRFESQYPTSLNKFWRVAPTINSDHHDLNWGNDSMHRVGIIAPALTQANLFEALRARRVFATEDDNLAIALQSNGAWMGSTITARTMLTFTVTVIDPDAEPIQLFLYDNGNIAQSQSFASFPVTWNVTVAGSSSHYYFVRAAQADGDIAYTAPIWTDTTPLPMPMPPTAVPGEKRWDLGAVSVDTARTTGAYRYVNIEACVIVPPGLFSNSYIFVQDDTGGIKVYMSYKVGAFPTMALADRLAVRGRVPSITGEREIQIEDAGTIQARGKCNPVQPMRVGTGAIGSAVEGRLVEVHGNLTSSDRGEFVIDDGSGELLIYIDSTTGIRLPALTRGQSVRIVGVVSRAHSQFAILPRYLSDLEFGARPNLTPTRTAVRPSATATRTPTLTPRVTDTATPTVSAPRASIEQIDPPRALVRLSNEPIARTPLKIDGQAVAVVGATTSAGIGFTFCALALLMWRRK